MRDTVSWSVSCGIWGGVRVYIHASLLAVSLFIVYALARGPAAEDRALDGLLCVAVLVVSILLHELGHVLAAWRVGGTVDSIILGPLGGLCLPHVPRDTHREVVVSLAGPMANFAVIAALAPPLVIADVNLADILLHPLYPVGGMFGGSVWLVSAKLGIWINWLLLLVNLMPAVPLDGGRALESVLCPAMGYRGAVRTVSRAGMLMALLLCLLGLLLNVPRDYPWLPLVLLSIYLFFASRQALHRTEEDESDDDFFGYDFSQGYTSLEEISHGRRHSQPGPLRRWLRQRRDLKQRRARDLEAEEERRVDEVLIRVKELGVGARSPEERALLERVSARYRHRLES